MLSLIAPPPVARGPRGTGTGYRADVLRVLPILVLVVLVLAVASTVLRWARTRVAPRLMTRRSGDRAGAYEWDRRTDQVRRRLKGVDGPQERRDDLLAFLDAHTGVEAYVEPKTVMSPKSVVLVDGEGAWRRFELREDAYLRRLAAERGFPIFDAALTGYPPRMRRHRGEDA
jgi:hypothetical protein